MDRAWKEFWWRLLDNLYHWSRKILPLRWACDRYDEILLSTGDSWDYRCPVCEGIQYPGLLHNPNAEDCTEWTPWIPSQHEIRKFREG